MAQKKFMNDRIQFMGGKLYSETNYKESVYGEKTTSSRGKNYRLWDPKRSKLSSAIHNGLRQVPIDEDSTVLYLGASFGTTVSHISDIVPDGSVFAVEFSPEPFAQLLKLAENRHNIYPLLENARVPERYSFFMERDPEIIYQDISQRDQVRILQHNLEKFKHWQYALLALKATSIDSSKKPIDVLRGATDMIQSWGNVYISETIDISNYHKGHFFLVMRNILH